MITVANSEHSAAVLDLDQLLIAEEINRLGDLPEGTITVSVSTPSQTVSILKGY